jgi:regulator of nonsense transcripts 1
MNKIVEIGTVDSFQGREKDIIVLSCVRANSSTGTIGFLSNRQRLNVSLTRAKYGLFIICNKNSLKINDDWNSCIQDAEDRNLIVDILNKENENHINFSQYLKKTGNL